MAVVVRDLMHRDVVRVHPDTKVGELDRTLAEHGISGVPVVDREDGRVVGIVSQSDVVRLISEGINMRGGFYDSPPGYTRLTGDLDEDLAQTEVRQIMERRIHSATPDEEISHAARRMRNLGVHRLLVLDQGHPIGVLSTLDMIRVLEDPRFFRDYYGLGEAQARARLSRTPDRPGSSG